MGSKYESIVIVFIVMIVCTLTLGYSAFGSEMSISNIVADVRIASDVRVTGVSMSSSSNGTVNSMEYDADSIFGNINLNGFNATVTLMVSITNFGNEEMGIWDITGLSDNLYKSISSYDLKTKLCDSNGNCSLGSITNFYITIGYDSYDAITKNHDIKLDFEFRKMHQVTYTGITNNGYPTSVIDGGDLIFTATSNIPPKIIAFTSTGDRYSYNDYSYINNKFTFYEASGDINLKYQAKAYMTLLDRDKYFKQSDYLKLVDSVYFVEFVDTSDSIVTFDLSSNVGSKEVVGWITSENDLYIGSDWIIYAKDLSLAFENMSSIKTIEFDNFNTSEAVTMYYMFKGCSGLTSLDVSSFDTSKVTNMGRMFQGMSQISSLDVSNFNTSNVTQMHGMFRGMSSLTSLDITNFNVSKVLDIYEMFYGLSNVEVLDLSNFKTGKVKSLYQTFNNMSSIKSLDLSMIDTSAATRMSYAFEGCSSLEYLNISNFSTSNVKEMASMFSGCQSLTSLDLSHFNTSKTTDMSFMFYNCLNLKYLNVSSFDTSNVTLMNYMFCNLKKLESLNIINFNTSNVTDMHNMFQNMNSLVSLDVSSFRTSNVTNMKRMFEGCILLTELDVSTFDTSNVIYMYYMFYNLPQITYLDLSNFDTSNVTHIGGFVASCYKLKTLDLRNANFDKVTSSEQMFAAVTNTINVIVGNSSAETFVRSSLGEGKGTITVVSV